MGVVFETPYRYFLVATAEVRGRRRVLQFEKAGITYDYTSVLEGILARDKADRERSVNPLKPHPEAVIIDTTNGTADDISSIILNDFLELE